MWATCLFRRFGTTSTAPAPACTRAVGEFPGAAMRWASTSCDKRYLYVFVGGVWPVGRRDDQPGYLAGCQRDNTSGQGWIAIGLVNFRQWDPLRAAGGAYAFGALRRLMLDLQGPTTLLGLRNPFYYNSYLSFFLQMLPYAFTIVVLVIGSREAMRKRLGAPAALGTPYIRSRMV